MKKIIYLLLLIATLSINCSEDAVVTNGTPTDIFGSWQVESAQMVQAPSGSNISAIMKQALVPFGEMPASMVGWCNVMFNTDSSWTLEGAITNNAIKIICNAYSSSYTAGGMFGLFGSNITFIVTNYSGPSGSQNVGTGTYSLTDKLTINLILANNERWKIVLIKSVIPTNINIIHTPLPNQPKSTWPATVSAEVTDNNGIQSVWVNWYINSPTNMYQFNLNNTSGNIYSAPFNSNISQVQFNDFIYYKIFARDNSSAHNMDSTNLYSFNIIPQDTTIDSNVIEFYNRVINEYFDDNSKSAMNLLTGVIVAETDGSKDIQMRDSSGTRFNFFLRSGDIALRIPGFETKFGMYIAYDDIRESEFDTLSKITNLGTTLEPSDFTRQSTDEYSNPKYIKAPLTLNTVYSFYLKGKYQSQGKTVYGMLRLRSAYISGNEFRLAVDVKINTAGQNQFRRMTISK